MSTSNLLFSSLSSSNRNDVLAHAQLVELPLRTVLYQPETEAQYAYFLISGMASVVASGLEGDVVEVEVIGCEGLVGAAHLLGIAAVPTQCFMQLPGRGLRLRFTDLRKLFLRSVEIRSRILEFVQVQTLTLSQLAGCHRMHNAERRLARWLLMVQDRTREGTLALTQESLAEMLGSQRTTVSAVASNFQKNGLIDYSRGRLRIIDRARLEEAACCCYAITKGLLTGLYCGPEERLYSGTSELSEVHANDVF